MKPLAVGAGVLIGILTTYSLYIAPAMQVGAHSKIYQWDWELRQQIPDAPNVVYMWRNDPFDYYAGMAITSGLRHLGFPAIVLLDNSVWRWSNERANKETVWHEVGHYIWGVGHSDNPCSLMYEVETCLHKSLEEKTQIAIKEGNRE